MSSYNRVILMGNLTKDPEYKQLPSGQAVCRLSVATNRQYKNKQTGMMQQEVCYVDVDVWGGQAESCNTYLQRGKSVHIEGYLKQESWQTADGQKRSRHVVVADRVLFLAGAAGANAEEGRRSDEQEAADQVSSFHSNEPKQSERKKKKKEVIEASDEEILFKEEPPFEDELPF